MYIGRDKKYKKTRNNKNFLGNKQFQLLPKWSPNARTDLEEDVTDRVWLRLPYTNLYRIHWWFIDLFILQRTSMNPVSKPRQKHDNISSISGDNTGPVIPTSSLLLSYSDVWQALCHYFVNLSGDTPLNKNAQHGILPHFQCIFNRIQAWRVKSAC
jgi:hypothetical protein